MPTSQFMRKKQKKNQFPLFDDSKFRALIEKSFDVIVLIDGRGKILYASPSIVRLYGRPIEEITGINGLKYIHPADFPKILKALALLIHNPKKTITEECRIKHKNGEWCWVTATATNLLQDENIRGIVVNFHDITERKILEQRKDEFISVASHELKTPITALKGYIQIIKLFYKKTDGEIEHFLKKIDDQVNRLTYLVDELLNISKIEEGKVILNKQTFDVGILIKEVVEDMQKLSGQHKIVIKKIISKKIIADRYRIMQVLINLLTNAIRYSPTGSEIIVRCREKNDFIFISVKDTGVGISKKNISKIFERFYQEKAAYQHPGGLGLGLYITSIFIKYHGGKILVRSQKGKGSTFTFSLPVKQK